MMDYLKIAKSVFEGEMECLNKTCESMNDEFNYFVMDLDRCNGTLIWMGIGKSGHICKKIVATMQSLGIKAVFLHPSEALHGDLGIISPNDIVIAVSNSGETKELLDTISPIKNLGARIFCITGRKNSTLEKASDRALVMDVTKEVFLGMVPTSTTTATLVMGDSIAVSIAKMRGFSKEDFGMYHPNGLLGKKLTMKIKDIMVSGTDNATILEGSNLEQVVFEMCRKPLGCVSIVDKNGTLKGLFTDGDLRRHLNGNTIDLKTTIVDDLMIKKPIILEEETLLIDAINNIILNNTVSVYPVTNVDGIATGTLRTMDVINSGLMS